MGREAGVRRIGAAHPQPSQAEVSTKLAWQARQQKGSADVGEEAYRGLRHREGCVFAGDAIRSMHRQANAAPHAEAVYQSDIRLGIAGNSQVQRIFLAEELVRQGTLAGKLRISQRANVSACTEGAVAGAL